ncbi:DNA helicase II [Clostridium acetireducens DSM 10703]|uniref:DNA 3'-5' helicase n=1 Tax=Clostridium acetireducens DSM 10703 TaxID=1121290 RepID=A0A1E8F1R2_9CLOT|nr:UvrD-helicase domain-containing protein [Clostridium acetireducens]OFI07126.1 DNA helicase II [Clostridium acetireducens DSM 10703]
MNKFEIKYSAIYYYSELDVEKLTNLKNKLKNGIIINLFLNYNFKEELDLNEFKQKDFFDYSESEGFFNRFDNLGELNYKEGLVAYDGNILNQNFYNDICVNRNNKFNSEQYEIINADINKNIIVTASAGTGKTTVMINRLLFLRKTVENFKFNNTILITFTNEASIEMRERLIELIEKYYRFTSNIIYLNMLSEISETQISTIHSFAKNIIDEFSVDKSINEKIKITTFENFKNIFLEEAIDKFSKKYKDIYSKLKYFPIYDIVNKLKIVWEKVDNYSIDLNSNDIKLDFGYDEFNISFFIKYVLKYTDNKLSKIKNNNLEINDLIKKINNLDLIKRINSNYTFLMIDEFQDMDNAQLKFIVNFYNIKKILLFIVGDEKQSIYRFRGAELTAFKKLKESLNFYKNQLIEFTLLQNYRTDCNLLNDINNLFKDINNRVEKFNYLKQDYIYSKIKVDKINSIRYISLQEDENKVKLLNKLLNKKDKSETIAVLVRNNKDALEIKGLCDRNNIPCQIEIKGDFYRHEAVRDFYLMIQSLIYENDNRVNYALINSPYIEESIDKIEVLEKINTNELKIYLNKFLDKNNWNYYRKKVHEVNPLLVIDEIIRSVKPEINYYKNKSIKTNKQLKNIKLMTLEYKINLDYLIHLLKDKFNTDYVSIETIEKFLRVKISTDRSIDSRKPSKKTEKEYVKCMTVHNSKGLQFDYVILPKTTNKFLIDRKVKVILRNEQDNQYKIGYSIKFGDSRFYNNYFIEYNKEEKSEIIAEETRLFYVAVTRCKKELYIDKRKISSNISINSWENLISGGIENV